MSGPDDRERIYAALGILTVRSAHPEDELVRLMAITGGMPEESAHAIFYSTANAKARLDAIRALIPVSPLDETQRSEVRSLLGRTKTLNDFETITSTANIWSRTKTGSRPRGLRFNTRLCLSKKHQFVWWKSQLTSTCYASA